MSTRRSTRVGSSTDKRRQQSIGMQPLIVRVVAKKIDAVDDRRNVARPEPSESRALVVGEAVPKRWSRCRPLAKCVAQTCSLQQSGSVDTGAHVAEVLVDDRRTYRVPRPDRVVIRDVLSALETLGRLDQADAGLDCLYLDHDLGTVAGRVMDIRPVVDWLEGLAATGRPLRVGRIVPVTSNPVGAQHLTRVLGRYYAVGRVDVAAHFVDDPTLPPVQDL